MGNINQNDIYRFFKDMPRDMQIEVINKMQRQAKKPPDSKVVEFEQVGKEVVQHLGAVR